MKLIVTIHELHAMDGLSAFADGFLLGWDRFGTRLVRSYGPDEMLDAIRHVKQLNREIYLCFNQIMNDLELEDFESFIKDFPLEETDGMVVADLGVMSVLLRYGYANKVIYHPETLLANAYDFNVMHDYQIMGAVVAKEITLEDILEIGREKKLKLFMVGHGHLNMFYSKRQLIDNYMDHLGKAHLEHQNMHLSLVEETRKDEAFPILEDRAGTHVFRSHVMSSLNHLETLEDVVDAMIIDTIFKDDAYALAVLKLYANRDLDSEKIKAIQNVYQERWDEGFLYKKTIYKPKG